MYAHFYFLMPFSISTLLSEFKKQNIQLHLHCSIFFTLTKAAHTSNLGYKDKAC